MHIFKISNIAMMRLFLLLNYYLEMMKCIKKNTFYIKLTNTSVPMHFIY